MNLVTFYDSETSRLPLWDQPSGDPRQPHIVQLAAVLFDLDAILAISCIDVIIKPNGWVSESDALALHGITTEYAMDVGVDEAMAVEMLLELCRGRTRIAFNEKFDQRIVRIALKRYFDSEIDFDKNVVVEGVQPSDIWKDGKAECTMALARSIMGGRNPTLGAAYLHFTGQTLSGAHSAMGDTEGCIMVHLAILDRIKAAGRFAAA